MKPLAVPALLLAAAAFAPRAGAQSCPFGVSFAGYGAACSPSGALPSTLAGVFTNANSGCSVSLTLTPAPYCCNIFVAGRFLVLGFQSAAIPLPTGCTLLAFPDVVLAYPLGVDTFVFPLPPDPALVGANAFAQGVVHRFDTFAYADYFDMTAGTSMSVY